MSSPVYRRIAPDPLPIDPYFQKIPGSEVFLRAIAEEPLEDVHRLAFADWLEEHSHAPRAEFIRMQCRFERLPDGHPARMPLFEQTTQLFKQHAKEWVAGLPRLRNVKWADATNFDRGMLEYADVNSGLNPKGFEELFASVDVRKLGLRPSCKVLRRFAESPWLSRLVSLEVSLGWAAFDPEGFRPLILLPALDGLVSLCIHNGVADWNRLIAALTEAGRFPSLSTLILMGNALGETGAYSLTHWPAAGAVRHLQLSLNRFGHAEMEILAGSPLFARLNRLNLSSHRRSSRLVETLAASSRLSGLRSLDLGRTPLTVRAIKALAASHVLSQLTSLDLHGARLCSDAIRVLARSPHVGNLRVLGLAFNVNIGDEGVRALAKSPHLIDLEALDLSWVGMTADCVSHLAGSPFLSNLTALSLRGNGLGNVARTLVASPSFNKLAFLDLRDNRLQRSVKAAILERWPFALV